LFAEAHRYDQDLSCIMVDLDGYKQLNDSYGHQVGDQLLIMAAKAISVNLRRMDIAARYGGDEFVLLLPRASSAEAAMVANRIRDEFRETTASLLRRSHGLTMSVGIGSLAENNAARADQLVALADAALYQAKEQGRNRICTAAEVAASQLGAGV
jgi:diguanylate cyclase (GGDEF)-like protein